LDEDKQKFVGKEPIAYDSKDYTPFQILILECTNEIVYWKRANHPRINRCKLYHSYVGNPYFKVNGEHQYLNTFMRTNIGVTNATV
jgi:hypothetical protein